MEAQLQEKLDKLHKDITQVKKILIGNGKLGVAEMARRSFEFVQHHDKTKNGRLDWAFRIMVGLVMTYVAVRVGIK